MPKVQFSKESLESKPLPPDGLYELRLSGFSPKFSKDKNSVNLNPQLEIVNHPSLNNTRVFDNLNTSAGWIIESFCHAFGQAMVPNPAGGFDMPGEFPGPEDNPEAWAYVGPLTGAVGKAFLKKTTYNGRDNVKVDQWFCSVPGCNTKHAQNLAK